MKEMSDQKSLSIWQYKPWWCQPWSILLTGVIIISASWVIFNTLWVTLIVSLPVLLWMIYFIIIYPKLLPVRSFFGELDKRETAIPK
jgi:membrane protein YdbS with pleckstrin-like domain